MDWGGPVSHSESSDEVVTVPDTPNPLSRGDTCELQRILTPLHLSVNYGIDVYERVFILCPKKLVLYFNKYFAVILSARTAGL